jgi:hypothetical protein
LRRETYFMLMLAVAVLPAAALAVLVEEKGPPVGVHGVAFMVSLCWTVGVGTGLILGGYDPTPPAALLLTEEETTPGPPMMRGCWKHMIRDAAGLTALALAALACVLSALARVYR